jgi:TIR domain-containing protein
MWDVVLCHAIDDSRLAETLAQTLADRGLRVWIDRTAPNTPKTMRVDAFVKAVYEARWCVFLMFRGRLTGWQVEQARLITGAGAKRSKSGLLVVVAGQQKVTWLPPELRGAAVFRVSGERATLADELCSLIGVPPQEIAAIGSGSQLDLPTSGRLAMASARDLRRRLGAWWWRQRRPVRRAIVGYAVVIVFAATYLLARAADPGLSLTAALIPASLAAAPLVIAFIGDRITGLKFMSFEVELADVGVELNDDVSRAIQDLADMDQSGVPQISDRILESIAHPDRDLLLRVNLGNGTAWWSTRVFLLAALASDYTRIQQVVFVDDGDRQHFIGLAAPMSARWSLARKFPRYETAYRKIRSNLATPTPPTDTGQDDRPPPADTGQEPTPPADTGQEPTPPADIGSEVNSILEAWPQEFRWNEAATKEFASRASLAEWLSDCLDPESIEWDGGPLTPLVRFQINSRPTQYVAMTSGGNLLAVVDRFALATQAERDVLQARLS